MTASANAPGISLGGLLGYRVDGVEGRIGVVEGVRGLSGRPSDATLVVRNGLFVRTRIVVPVADVAEIAAASRRIVVQPPGAAA